MIRRKIYQVIGRTLEWVAVRSRYLPDFLARVSARFLAKSDPQTKDQEEKIYREICNVQEIENYIAKRVSIEMRNQWSRGFKRGFD